MKRYILGLACLVGGATIFGAARPAEVVRSLDEEETNKPAERLKAEQDLVEALKKKTTSSATQEASQKDAETSISPAEQLKLKVLKEIQANLVDFLRNVASFITNGIPNPNVGGKDPKKLQDFLSKYTLVVAALKEIIGVSDAEIRELLTRGVAYHTQRLALEQLPAKERALYSKMSPEYKEAWAAYRESDAYNTAKRELTSAWLTTYGQPLIVLYYTIYYQNVDKYTAAGTPVLPVSLPKPENITDAPL